MYALISSGYCPVLVGRGHALPAEAPAELGYEDVNASGTFKVVDGRRRPVVYSSAERLAVNVAYSKLQAFSTGEARGWGVRCTVPITSGQVVIEVRGRCLSEAEYEELADPSYVVSFDDKLLLLDAARWPIREAIDVVGALNCQSA